MTPYRLIYTTVSKPAEAKKIALVLLKERLVACVNIYPKIQSWYWWEEKINTASETVLIAKTHQKKVKALITKIKKLHSYTCPCIVSLPIDDGNLPFLGWIKKETRS